MYLGKFINALQKEKDKFQKKHKKAYAPEIADINYDYGCCSELEITLVADRKDTGAEIEELVTITMSN